MVMDWSGLADLINCILWVRVILIYLAYFSRALIILRLSLISLIKNKQNKNGQVFSRNTFPDEMTFSTIILLFDSLLFY